MHRSVGEVRPSQLITTFGPGAIVDLPHVSVIVGGLDHWSQSLCMPIEERRLENRLGVRIVAPPQFKYKTDTNSGTVPAFRFPEYMVCPRCRRLAPYRSFVDLQEQGKLECRHPGTGASEESPARVFPVRFIVACTRGHIHDFPWEAYVHRGPRRRGTRCERLTLQEKGSSGMIEDVEVGCSCGASRSLADSFKDRSSLGKCDGWRPWLGPDMPPQGCGNELRPMLRGASNAYFPLVESALSLPEGALDPLQELIPTLQARLQALTSLQDLITMWRMFPEADKLGVRPEDLWSAWLEVQDRPDAVTGDLLLPEWRALTTGQDLGRHSDFETAEQPVPSLFREHISTIVQVPRLTEVRVLTGFTRVNPPPDMVARMEAGGAVTDATRVPLGSERCKGWLPGVVIRGEGVFLTLNEERVHAWENSAPVREAEAAFRATYERFCEDRSIPPAPDTPTARYILLHSLAHALMRQLSLNSGYSSTALRERVYSRTRGYQKMAGILIYTATPDSEGSLGGLVEQGEMDRLGAALWEALHEATFCSGDPLCAESSAQSVGSINGAVCHACLLASETSCERSNRFLDRSFLVPTVSRADLAFLGGCLR